MSGATIATSCRREVTVLSAAICCSADESTRLPMLCAIACKRRVPMPGEQVHDHLAQIVGTQFRIAFVTAVVEGEQAPLRGPAEDHRRTVEGEVIGDLRGASKRVLERDIEAVHEEQRLVTE